MLLSNTKMISLMLLAMLVMLSSCGSDDPTSDTEPQPKPQKTVTPTDDDAADSAALVAIELVLPDPMFRETPSPIIVPGGKILKLSNRPRDPFLAPAGVTNVAAGKPVSASDEFPIVGELEYVTDGQKDASDGYYVDLGPFLQYVTIDLEKQYNIYAIVVWHYHKSPRAFIDVVVQIADDPDFVTNVRTIFNNDHDNSADLGVGTDWHYVETNEGKLLDAKGQKARYVRLYSDGNSKDESSHYIEVEVYGKQVQ